MITTIVKVTLDQYRVLEAGGTVGSHTYDPVHCFYVIDDGLVLPQDSGKYVIKTDDDGETYYYDTIDLTWNEISGKPSTFPPSAHTHSAADITTGTIALARLPVGTAATQVAAGNHTHSAYVNQNAFGNVKVGSTTTAASSITDTITFAAGGDLGVSISGKTVSYSITLPTQLPASDVYPWAKASSKPTYDWSEITNRPTTVSSFTNDANYVSNSSAVTDNSLARFDGATGKLIKNSSIISESNGDLKVGRYAYNVLHAQTTDTPYETIIHTKIKYASSSYMPVIRIYGYAYGLQCPIEFKLAFYIYDGNMGWCGAVSMGAWRPTIYVFKETVNNIDYIAIGLKGACYFLGFDVDVQFPTSTYDPNVILTTGWSVTFNTSSTTSVIPTSGVDVDSNNAVCRRIPYKSTLNDLTIITNGVTNTYNGVNSLSLNLDNNYATTSHTHNYSEIYPGNVTVGDGANTIFLRTAGSWSSAIYHQTTQDESVVFLNKGKDVGGTANYSTSWIFAYGDTSSRPAWTSLTPVMQIKENGVVINKLLTTKVAPAYNLDVNGTANATTIYENGTALSDKYLGITETAADSSKLSGKTSSYYLNYDNLTNKPSIPSVTVSNGVIIFA